MTRKSPSPMAGGFAIAVLSILGVLGGSMCGQPSLGLLVGAGLGVLIAIAVWLVDRVRR